MDINFKDSDIISEINGYINEIVDNNKKIKTLLDNYSYLLDFSDLKILEIFLNTKKIYKFGLLKLLKYKQVKAKY